MVIGNHKVVLARSFLSILMAGILTGASTPVEAREKHLFKVEKSGKSLFFGSGNADPDFDYTKWAGKKKLFVETFDKESWDEYAPLPEELNPNKVVKLERTEAEKLFLRFQRSGALARKHQALVEGLLNSEIVEESPILVSGLLQNALNVSKSFYDELVENSPRVTQFKWGAELKNPFRSKEEEKEFNASALDYFDKQEDRLFAVTDGVYLKDWINLLPLAPSLHTISESSIEARMDHVMESIMDTAMEKEFKHSGASYLFPVIEPAVEPLFGQKPEVITTLEMSRRKDEITPMIHGTDPLAGLSEKKNRYGFYSAELPSFSLNDSGETHRTFNWEMAGHRFKAKVEFKEVEDAKTLLSKESGPNYKEMKKDGTLHLLVLWGSNFRTNMKENLQEYLDYLNKKGFQKRKTKNVTHFKGWLKEKIKNGELAFIDKEAHATGDVDNFLEVDDEMKILTFTKGNSEEDSEKPEAEVRIAYPYKDSKRITITNEEFGEWIRAREKDNAKPFILGNFSCWSVDQARLQIPEVRSAIFSEIISTSVTSEFLASVDSGVSIVVDGFLKGWDYQDMRAEMEKKFAGDQDGNDKFYFPDEAKYRSLIFQGGTPTRIRWEITDLTTGKRYDADNLAE